MTKIIATENVASTLDETLLNSNMEITRVSVDSLVKEAVGQGATAIISRSEPGISSEEIHKLGRAGVKIIGRACVGYDGIDLGAAYNEGIAVINTPGPARIPVAELTIHRMIELARGIREAERSLLRGEWKPKQTPESIYKKRLGIVGVGNIGSKVAELAKAYNMDVYGFDPYLPKYRKKELRYCVDGFVDDLNKVLTRCDIITVHTPLTNETRGMFGSEQFKIWGDAKSKRREHDRGSPIYFLNMARGGIVVEEDLLKALEGRILDGAALDVFETEPVPKESQLIKYALANAGRLLLTPHIGASVTLPQEEIGIELGDNLIRYLSTGSVSNIVNLEFEHVDLDFEYQPMWRYHGLVEFLGYLSGCINQDFSGICLEYHGEYRKLPSPETYLLQIHALKGIISALSSDDYTIVDATKLRNESPGTEAIEGTDFFTKHALIHFQGKDYHLTRRPHKGSGESFFSVNTYWGCFDRFRVVAEEQDPKGFTVRYYNNENPIFTDADLSSISGYVLVVHHQKEINCDNQKVKPLTTLELPAKNGLLTVFGSDNFLTTSEMTSLSDSVIKARQFYVD